MAHIFHAYEASGDYCCCAGKNILHGDAERFAAIKVHRLKKKGIHFKHKMFRNTGHVELIHKDPRILLSIIDKAYIDKL